MKGAPAGRAIRDLAKIGIEEAGPDLFGLAAWLDFASPGWKEIQTKEEDKEEEDA